jgi:hypothetical protein
MANTTLTADIVAKEALAILENELGVINRLHRAHEEEFSQNVNGYKVGDTISIRRPADFTIRTGATLSTQDVIEGKTTLVIDQQCGVDFQFSSTDLTLKIEDLSTRVIKPAMSTIINYMANDVLTKMYQGIYNWVGDPGQTVNSFADFAKAPERLDKMAVPQENRASAFNPTDFWGFVGAQTALYAPSLVTEGFRRGELGMVGNIDTLMSQVVPSHTVGPLGGTPLVNGASQNVTYDTAKNAWTQSLITDGWTAAAASRVKAGDVFKIYAAGTSGAYVKMVNPKTKAVTDVDQQFVVISDGSSDGSGNLTLTISPPIITSGPHQTVNVVPADNAGLTFLGTAATTYNQNLVFHKNTMALAMVPMELPQAAYGAARQTYKGMSVRVIPIYDGTNDISKWRLDLLYGRKLLDPRLAVRLSGSS